MTTLDLIAVALVCLTALGCTWIVAERWYAHRDRSYARLVASTEVASALAIDDVKKVATAAANRLDAHVEAERARVDELAVTVKRHEDLEQGRAHDKVFGRSSR